MSTADACRYVIPTPVIDHFLTDYKRNGQFTGFPSLGIRWQRMESDHLRCAVRLWDLGSAHHDHQPGDACGW